MRQIPLGFSMFFTSVTMAVQFWPGALKAAWPLILLYVCTVGGMYFGTTHGGIAAFMALATIILQIFLTVVLAVYLHRVVLLPPDESRLKAAERRKIVQSYLWRWLPMVILVSILGSIIGGLGIVVMIWEDPQPFGADHLFGFSLEFLLVSFVGIAFPMFLFYRHMLGLPALACGGAYVDWGKSWALTAPVGIAVFTMCVCGSFVVCFMTIGVAAVFAVDGSQIVLEGLWEVVSGLAMMLVGACMLTQVYLITPTKPSLHSPLGNDAP